MLAEMDGVGEMEEWNLAPLGNENEKMKPIRCRNKLQQTSLGNENDKMKAIRCNAQQFIARSRNIVIT